MDPLEAYREGLALARRAGMSWSQREPAAYEAALAVAPTKTERSDWACALYDARARLDARLRATADRLVVVANMLPRTRSLACRDADPLVFREQGGGIIPTDRFAYNKVVHNRSAFLSPAERGSAR